MNTRRRMIRKRRIKGGKAKIKVNSSILNKVEVSKVELVKTRQGEQWIDGRKVARAVNEMSKLIGNRYNSEEESKKAEDDFREYLRQKGYTRF